MPLPSIFLIEGNNLAGKGKNFLTEVNEELDTITRIVLEGNRNWKPIKQSLLADPTSIFDIIHREKDSLKILHFSGHASSNFLELFSSDNLNSVLNTERLAMFLGLLKQPELIFLNSCNTVGSIEALIKRGAKAIIFTNAPVNDQIAKKFCIRPSKPILILPPRGLTFGSKVNQWTQSKQRPGSGAAGRRCMP